ncbi:MAG: transcriptional repressor [Myxococcota bacterium]|nr:transcriptional repressor [Myxococcota bacterium]
MNIVDEHEVQQRLARFTQAARDAGLKLTQQRLEIFRELASRVDHPSAEALFKALKPRLPTVSLDTIYRTLWMLAELNVALTLGPKQGSVRFDANLEQHHHFVCTQCGLTRDFNSEALDALPLPEEAQAFGTAQRLQLEVRGLCIDCSDSTVTGAPSSPSKRSTDE